MEANVGEAMQIEPQDVPNQDAAPTSDLAQEPQPMAVDGSAGNCDV